MREKPTPCNITGSNWSESQDFKKHLPDGETTQQHLADSLHSTQTVTQPITEFDPYAEDDIDCDEVYPAIYIGDAATAKNIVYLKRLGITHLLNAAQGKKFGFVNTDERYYSNTAIKYLGLPLADLCTTDISKYFYTAATFIDEAVSTGGKVFVHCMLGISRSATCVLAYLMIKKEMLAVDAIRAVRKNRFIEPNRGFLHQLAQLDNHLRRQRL
ncbi:dual specificity protein phosphatase 3 isoform X1 [Osmia lignaria lignaria]|uniref:dual specificity protein phosphatase 3 isoform X1 n=1 Tax=Osmia lignaria lignaria TaxID=1437193 RepID=UPI0014790F83|nr:dual specificity protein phosphatase 3 isoform X1 [Osmia lignaria]